MEDIIQEEVMVACKDQAQIMKGKRTKRQRAPSPLRLAIAMPCATASSNEICSGGSDVANTSSSELRDSTPSTTMQTEEEEDMANCLILLAQGKFSHPVGVPKDGAHLYQCKTCDRGFPSFRALGGHRARHKKTKPNPEDSNHVGCDDYCTGTALSLQLSSSKVSSYNGNKSSSKVHECSICGAEFSSGQALGGHMRRHRTLVNASATTTITSSPEVRKPRNVFKLDLNLPAPDEDHDHRAESKFPFHSKDSVLVFSASPLVDCPY
ncbi:zinc finger protein ZAT5-like [Neltuma alba]|uniref:zinc finger protein ZAT5-like n=1 Tax=Neltuma alba TaxID=207710 RepID=UPI0010A4002D|nr:zinc finger protein ZAT5-like [Prosopis alba]